MIIAQVRYSLFLFVLYLIILFYKEEKSAKQAEEKVRAIPP